MIIQIALLSSVILQFGAFFNTLKLIRRTKFNISWITISIAFFLMAIRRLSEFATFANSYSPAATDYFNSWMAVLISLLMFVASFYIRRIFNLQSQIDNMRKENEARVLSAIIETEEKERQSFAREMHDGLGPVLSSVKMAFSAIDLKTTGEKNRRIIEKTESSVDHAILTVREISNHLSPHLLAKFGLKKAIHTFYEGISRPEKPGLKFFSHPDRLEIPYNIEVILYRIISELINNTLKHASAANIEISLIISSGQLDLHYSDDGKGYEPSTIQNKKGTGLSNIHSRIKSLGGKMEIHTKKNRGFLLKTNIPL